MTLILLSLLISFGAVDICFAGIDIEKSPLGENRISLSKKHFSIKIENKDNLKIKAFFDSGSYEWVRVGTLLLPRLRVRIKLEAKAQAIHLEYKKKIVSFQQAGKYAYTELYYSPFESERILIRNSHNEIANIKIEINTKHFAEKALIDYTCARNGIVVDGAGESLISLGCTTQRIGSFGKERARLEVSWYSPTLRVKNTDTIPYHAIFITRKPVHIDVVDIKTGVEKTLTIKASVPKRLHRLFTAYGFGPYVFETEKFGVQSTEKISEDIAPAIMFYANYKISQEVSIRGFDAAIFKESTFNNAGIYLGNNFGYALDNKLYFTTLLGAQHLYFKFNEESPVTSEIIFPQGIEFMYRHAFDIPNYIISGGAFLSPSESIDYQNLWIRWGKNYFWELNYIYWGKEGFSAKTWGVSVGFPFKGFL